MSSTPCIGAFDRNSELAGEHEVSSVLELPRTLVGSSFDSVRGVNGSPVDFDGPMDFEKNDMMD